MPACTGNLQRYSKVLSKGWSGSRRHPQRLLIHSNFTKNWRVFAVRGWSYDNGEDYADVRCVAAPVFNANNELTAAISVVGTRLQINEEYRDYLAGKAIACARGYFTSVGMEKSL